ncbi:hypothetical protein D3C78_1334870 [compost metagenome]
MYVSFVIGLQPLGLPPPRQGKQVGIGDREGVAEQVLAAGQLLIDPRKTCLQFRFYRVHVLAGQSCIEQGNKALVNLRRQKAQPLLQPIAFQCAVGRGQSGFRSLVGQVLHNHRSFAKPGAVGQFKDRHVAEGVYRVVIEGTVHGVLPVIHLEQRDIKPQFIDDDMRGKGATARDVVKLHNRSPKWIWSCTFIRKVLQPHLRDKVYKWKKALFYHLGT